MRNDHVFVKVNSSNIAGRGHSFDERKSSSIEDELSPKLFNISLRCRYIEVRLKCYPDTYPIEMSSPLPLTAR